MIRSFEPDDGPNIDSVWTWFEFQIALLGESRARVLRSLAPGSDVAGEVPRPSESRFIGDTHREVEAFFDAQRGRLELLTMFELLATTEAVLRIDLHSACRGKEKRWSLQTVPGILQGTRREGSFERRHTKRNERGGRPCECRSRLSRGAEAKALACAWPALAPKARPWLHAERCFRYFATSDRFDSSGLRPRRGQAQHLLAYLIASCG